jgi:hypothetical protein
MDRGPGGPTKPAPGKCRASFGQPRSISPLPSLQARNVSMIQAATSSGASEGRVIIGQRERDHSCKPPAMPVAISSLSELGMCS